MNTSSPDTKQTTLRYLPGLDGLRAVSVLAVFVFHHYWVGGHELGWAPGGFLGVEVFFVVSGYLITSLLLAERRETGAVSYQHFYLRRARRLLPALWVLLAVVVAYSLLFLPDAIGTLRSDVLAALTYTSNWWQIVANRNYFELAGRPELLKHLWSLAIEEQFYIVWPLALVVGLRKLGRKRMIATTISVAFASAVLCAVLVHVSINFAYYSTFTRLSGLLSGSAFAFFFAPYRIRGLPGRGVRIALNVAGACGLFVLLWSFGVLHGLFGHLGLGGIGRGFTFPTSGSDSLAVFHVGFVLVDIATLFVIAAAVHPVSDVGRSLGVAPLRWVGVRSYGLYLWHYPIFCVTRPWLDFEGFFHLHGWPVFVLRTGLSFGAADLSYRYVETPIRSGALARYRERLRDAQGERRNRLLRRGVVVGGSLSLVAVMLGTGLANAQPQVTRIPGIDEAQHKNDNGATYDPSALAALRGFTGRGSPSSTTVPVGAHRTKPAGPQLPSPILAIGDSVMLGSKGALEGAIPGIAVDAKVSRQFRDAVAVINQYKGIGWLPATIVIHLGTNGHITDAMFDGIMQALGPGRQVYFLTARVPRLWETEVNSTLHAGAQRYRNAHVLEWRDFAGCHDDWFVSDGFHLQPPGQRGYATFVKSALLGHPLTTCTK